MKLLSQTDLFSRLSIEQKILLATCSVNDFSSQRIEKLFTLDFNWDSLTAICERHRLTPLFYNNLRNKNQDFVVEIPDQLRSVVHGHTQNTLKLATEGIKISEALMHIGIRSILLKGPFLAEQLYANPAIRPSRDLDILVNPEDLGRTHNLLLEHGYIRVYPDFELSRKQAKFYLLHKNQFAYRNKKNGVLLELHWRLFWSNHILPISTNTVFNESQPIQMADKKVFVLSKQHAIQFLCLHGAIHLWFRLLWLRDIAQLVNDQSIDQLEVLDYSRRMGTDRAVEQALRLSNLFFSTTLNLPPNSSRTVISLMNKAVVSAIEDERKIQSRKLRRLMIPFYKMKIERGLLYKMSCWSLLQPHFDDWKAVRIPDSLFFLYFLLRPFIWIKRAYFGDGKKN